MSRRTLPVFVSLLFVAPVVQAQYIGIFMDPQAASCAASVGDTPWIDLHVIALPGGNAPGLTGVQFRVVGVPAGWTQGNALWVPDLGATVSLGHPLFPSSIHPSVAGVNVAFSTCKTDALVHLGRIVLLGAPTPGEVHLQVTGFDLVPPDPDCPFFVDCSMTPGHFFEPVCVAGGEIVLNGPARPSCQMAVTPETWAGVKSLYLE